jgi:hypothetical protein
MSLLDTIEDHRLMYRADLYISKMVAQQPPTSLDANTGVLHQETATQIGMNMNGRLLKYLGHPEGYGSDFPWAKALWKLRIDCRRDHPHHRSGDRPYWRGALCHEAVRLVVIGGDALGVGPLPPESAAAVLKLDHYDELLTAALRDLERIIDNHRVQAVKRERQLEAHAIPVNAVGPRAERHDQGGLHRLDCPKCRRDVA